MENGTTKVFTNSTVSALSSSSNTAFQWNKFLFMQGGFWKSELMFL